MRAKKEELPIKLEEGAQVRQIAWGGMVVSYERIPAGFDTSLYMQGLPDNRCQCPHWGHVLKGRARVTYADHEETFTAGDVYYLEPGHTEVFEEDYEALEFSPKKEFEETMEVIMANFLAMQGEE